MRATLSEHSQNGLPPLRFVPIRGDFSRGIFATVYTPCSLSQNELNELYTERYKAHPFTIVSPKAVHLKQAVNTNLAVLSAIDNLLKGAVGQAVENMNLMFDLPQSTGLNLKASAF